MRSALLTLIFSLYFILPAGACHIMSSGAFYETDTLPPDPPDEPGNLTGPTWACVGETSVFSIDVPVGCMCQWSVNNLVQPGSDYIFSYTWTTGGTQEVSVVFVCSGGFTSEAQTILVDVFTDPAPTPIQGDELVCEYTYHTYSTEVGPLDSCQWSVNGESIPGYGASLTYSFGAAGTYHFEVFAFSPCGISPPQALDVIAQGTAPSAPSPIEGPDKSCTGNTDIYTTTVEPGTSCAWWIDGILQPSVTTTLEVTWTDRGNHLIEARAVSDCGTGNPAIKNVLVLYQPDVHLGNDTVIIQGQTLLLDAGNPGLDYLWSTGDTTQTIEVNTAGTYDVTVSGNCGIDADTIDVSVIIGVNEFTQPDDCFGLIVHQRKLELQHLPEKIKNIQVMSINGLVLEESHSNDTFILPSPGIYLVRIITDCYTCTRKVVIR